ncbi:MAG: hypothetical protein QOJ79_2815 [Actinomycetota bacterium]|nr:hypothetical protein [Actinomycetota bacterium]
MNDTDIRTTAIEQGHQSVRRMFNSARRRWLAAGAAALTLTIAGVCAGLAASSASPAAAQAAIAAGRAGGFGAGGAASNARSGPASGGSVGTVNSVSASGFTLATSGGQTVTVVDGPATTYENGTSPGAANDVTVGAPVLVLGTANSMTITATQVIVRPPVAASSAAAVVPFQRGAPTTSRSVGQIPSGYTEGSGTIVSDTAALSATKAALAAYPGGLVDRVVQLSSGEYEVHNIGVNWPHHVFVTQGFQVVGAD